MDIFSRLKDLLIPYSSKLTVKTDTPDEYYLDAGIHPRRGRPLFFGAVKRGKQYVSFHLMPVYVYPDLLDTLSDNLKRRMQGKSCFNFRKFDPSLFAELEDLTRRSYERYEAEGLVGHTEHAEAG